MELILKAIKSLFKGIKSEVTEAKNIANKAVENAVSEVNKAKMIQYLDFERDKEGTVTINDPSVIDSVFEAVKEGKFVIAKVKDYMPIQGYKYFYLPLSSCVDSDLANTKQIYFAGYNNIDESMYMVAIIRVGTEYVVGGSPADQGGSQ